MTTAELQALNQRSDRLGLLQSVGYLAVLSATGFLSWWCYGTRRWVAMSLLLYLHGGLFAFSINGIHELSHNTVFRYRYLNSLFRVLYGLLFFGSNPYLFNLSHRLHHRYTLYRDSDGEEVHPRRYGRREIAKSCCSLISLVGLLSTFHSTFVLSALPLEHNRHLSDWNKYILTEAKASEKRAVQRMARAQLFVHLLWMLYAISNGHWFLLLLTTGAPFYGARWYQNLINNTQHVGMRAGVPDYRLNSRSIRLDLATSFLYWHMG